MIYRILLLTLIITSFSSCKSRRKCYGSKLKNDTTFIATNHYHIDSKSKCVWENE